jgi:uncharacterized protein (TIGR03083 family)
MPRPTTKALLLSESGKERTALDAYLAELSPEQMLQAGIVGEWTVKDVLAHLYEWEQMVLGWLAAGQRGETPYVPAEGYNWGQLPALNEEIRRKHQVRSLEEVLALYRESYREITEAMQGLPEETLFTRGLYPWMNKNALAAYFTSATGSHYRWARKELRKGFRALISSQKGTSKHS